MDITTLKNDQLIGVYRKLRERRDEAKKAFTESQKPTLELMERIEGELMLRMQDTGTNTFSCDTGTAYRVTNTTVSVKDWSAFLPYVLETQQYDMLERRAAKSAVVEFVDEHKELPPGLAMTQVDEVNIRAPKGG